MRTYLVILYAFALALSSLFSVVFRATVFLIAYEKRLDVVSVALIRLDFSSQGGFYYGHEERGLYTLLPLSWLRLPVQNSGILLSSSTALSIARIMSLSASVKDTSK